MTNNTQRVFIFIGRAGAGKGTQAKLLMQRLQTIDSARSVLYVETGAEFRKFIANDPSHTAKLGRDIIETGGLMPEFMPVYMWGKLLVDQCTGNENVIFDGTPRKLLEAKLLDSVFPFYGWQKPFVIYLDIEHDESARRLSLRAQHGRKDDSPDAIERRRIAFEQDVKPTVDWYRSNPNIEFLDIPGTGAIEDIHADIVKRTGLG